jgi:hypothetical protein
MNSSTLEVLYEAKSFTQSASSRFQFLGVYQEYDWKP